MRAVPQESAIATFGETLFAHAPRLHTFLLSDAPMKADDFSMTFPRKRQLDWLEEWDEHPNALKKVAFTTDFVWTKTEEGWQAPPINEDSGDEDDDDEGEGEDDGAVESDGSAIMVEFN